MNTQATEAVEAVRQALYSKVEAKVHTFEAQVAALKAKAESAKADAELVAIANLATARRTLDRSVAQLKSAGATAFLQIRDDVENRLAEFDRSVQAIASRINAR